MSPSAAEEEERDGSGVRKAVESKEKKRRVILSDSDSEEDHTPMLVAYGAEQKGDSPEAAGRDEEFRVDDDKKRAMSLGPAKQKVPGADQKADDLESVRRDEEVGVDGKKRPMSLGPSKQKAPGAEQKSDGPEAARRDEDLGADDKKRAMGFDPAKQTKEAGPNNRETDDDDDDEEFNFGKKRDTWPLDVGQREETSSDRKNTTSKGRWSGRVVFKTPIERDKRPGDAEQREEASANWKKDMYTRKYDREVRFDKGRPSGFTSPKREEEYYSDKKRSTYEKQIIGRPDAGKQRRERNTEYDFEVDKKRHGRSSAVKEREKAITNRKKATEYYSSEEEPKVDRKRAMRSDVTKKREEAITNRKKVTEYYSSEEEPNVDRKRAMRSDVIKKREEAANDQKKVTEKRSSRQVLSDDEERPMSTSIVKKGVEAGSDRKRASERRNDNEEPAEKKRFVKTVVKQREEAGTDKKKGTYNRSDKEELKFDKKRAASPDKEKSRGEAGSNKRKDAKLGSEHTLDRKRTRETLDADISLKRIKRELKHWECPSEETDGKKMKSGYHKNKDERAVSKRDQVLASESAVPSSEQRDSLNEKSSPAKLEKTSKIETEKVRSMETSGQRALRKLKDNSICIKKEDRGILQEKGMRLQGKGAGSLTVLPSNKKVGGFEEVHSRRGNGDKVKGSTSSTSSATSNCSTPEHRSISTAEIDIEKSISTAALGQNKSNKKKSYSVEKHKSHEEKTEMKVLSRELKKKALSSRKPNIARKGEDSSTSKTPLLTTKNPKEAKGRSGAKRKITERIKGILLSAGWKIDLRPRRGRNYEDQVYIPPTGGSGYWSITKAYAVFEEQSRKSSKKSTGSDNNFDATGSSSAAIPAEFLSMLKRNVVKKRRRRVEDEETQGSRNKKVKETTKMKHSSKKQIKDRTAGVRGRKKSNSLVVPNNKDPLGKSNTKQKGRTLLVRGSNQGTETEYDDYVPYIWKRTVLSWMIDLGIVSLNGKVKYMSKKQTRTMLEGQIVRDGILCSCCSKILTVSKFEIHAGSKLHQPYENIFVEESGISLLQCQLDAWEKQDESERRSFYTIETESDDPSDDTCGICGDGGDLICCDGCPSTFHQSCLGIEMLPSGDWHCTNCSCRFCGLVSEASAQGSGVPVSPLPSCYQCEKKYHQECIPEEYAISTISNNSPASFCGKSCRKVFRRLQKLLGVKNDLEAGLSWRLIRRLDEDSPLSPFGLPKRAECNAKIAVARAVMDECFLPIIDQRTGINLIHNIVYNCGSNINRMSYNGFYTFILERGDEIIGAASVRIHGTRLAEMPFIGTRNMYRRQGMCRRLLNTIESALCSIGIQKMIVPAISELTDTWTIVFGFKPLDTSQKEEVKSVNMLVFPGTGLLQKSLLNKNSSQPTDEDGKFELRMKDHCTPEIEPKSSVLSSAEPNLHASDEVIVLPESTNTPCGFEFHAPEYKSPENAADSNLFIQPEAVCHDAPARRDKYQVDSLDATKTKLSLGGSVNNDDDVEIEDAGAVLNSQAVEDTLVQHTSEANCTSQDATVSTLPECEVKTPHNLPYTDDTSLPHNSEPHCRFSGATASILPHSGGNELHIPASSLEDISDHNTSDVRSTSSSVLPVECSIQTLHELRIKDAAAEAKPDADDHDAELHISGIAARSCALAASSEQCHASDIVCKAPDVTPESISSTSGVESCKITGVSPHADPVDPQTADAGKKILDLVTKDSALFDLCGSDLCSSVLGDAHNKNAGNAPSAPDHCAIPALTKHDVAEGIGKLAGLCKNNDTGPAAALNTLLHSASVIIQHDLKVVSEATADIPVELNAACSEAESQTGTSKGKLAFVEPTHVLGVDSSHCASEVVTVSLGNDSEFTDGTADVDI